MQVSPRGSPEVTSIAKKNDDNSSKPIDPGQAAIRQSAEAKKNAPQSMKSGAKHIPRPHWYQFILNALNIVDERVSNLSLTDIRSLNLSELKDLAYMQGGILPVKYLVALTPKQVEMINNPVVKIHPSNRHLLDLMKKLPEVPKELFKKEENAAVLAYAEMTEIQCQYINLEECHEYMLKEHFEDQLAKLPDKYFDEIKIRSVVSKLLLTHEKSGLNKIHLNSINTMLSEPVIDQTDPQRLKHLDFLHFRCLTEKTLKRLENADKLKFINPEHLKKLSFDQINKRFAEIDRSKMSEKQISVWDEKKQDAIRLRNNGLGPS